jgi:hypothetical protein
MSAVTLQPAAVMSVSRGTPLPTPTTRLPSVTWRVLGAGPCSGCGVPRHRACMGRHAHFQAGK